MKRKSKKTAGVFLLAVILTAMFITSVYAQTAEKKGSITIELNELGTNRENVALECFFVAEKKEEVWRLTDTFNGSGVQPWNLEKSTDYKKAAEKLSSWTAAEKAASEIQTTDRSGKLAFSNLEEGIYLIRQKSGQKTYGVIAPFLVCIPMEENGIVIYDVHTSTKGEEIKNLSVTPTESVTPAGSSGSSGKTPSVRTTSSRTVTVKTGDDTAVVVFWILLILAAGGTVGVLYYRKKH